MPTSAWSNRYASRADRFAVSEIRELLKLLDQPDIISFAGGIPDPELFDPAAMQRAYDRILADPVRAKQALQYASSEGYPPLRAWLAAHMRSLGVLCDADNILITNGSQQGLDFVGKLFVDRGDTVLVNGPTYLGGLQAFNAYEPDYDTLPEPGSNRTPESYRGPGKRPRLIYAMADFRNPSGRCMTRQERLDLLALAEALDVPVVEDNAYAHLRYDGEAVPSLTALHLNGRHIDEGRCLYLGTFSKSIAPGLRLAWICAPRAVIETLVMVKQGADLQSSTLNQIAMADVLPEIYEEQVARSIATYRTRRDTMLEALARHMPTEAHWSKPEGGMFLWVTLPQGVDTAALLKRAVELKVAFVPGAAFFTDRSQHNHLRLSFSRATPEQIETGIARLGQLCREAVAARAA
ncbi:MAG: PLP-dependent aminotransferase family protein [Alphaproteobacteria bacterium]|nr:PLP-dependent aminotransferase family protein [Alphaproteobacteria bacterium]TAD90988.1 MAG: PLP-dependent aminotransferase family protein [Alphaproteobacteria bacterium]